MGHENGKTKLISAFGLTLFLCPLNGYHGINLNCGIIVKLIHVDTASQGDHPWFSFCRSDHQMTAIDRLMHGLPQEFMECIGYLCTKPCLIWTYSLLDSLTRKEWITRDLMQVALLRNNCCHLLHSCLSSATLAIDTNEIHSYAKSDTLLTALTDLF